MILLKNIEFKQKKKIIYSNLNLNISDNMVIGIHGPNGSGKTTLLKLIAGIYKPASGNISYTQKYKFGLLISDLNVQSVLNIKDFVSVFKSLAGNNQPINKLLEDFDLLSHKTKKYEELSSGLKMRLIFLLTLINNPNVILLDEPTNSLDEKWQTKITDFVIENKKNRIIVVVSHDRNFLNTICDKQYDLFSICTKS